MANAFMIVLCDIVLSILYGLICYGWICSIAEGYGSDLDYILLCSASASVYLQLFEYTLGIPTLHPEILDTLFVCCRYGLLVMHYVHFFYYIVNLTLQYVYMNFGEGGHISRPFSDRIVKVTHDDRWEPEDPTWVTKEDVRGLEEYPERARRLENWTVFFKSSDWEPEKYKCVYIDLTGFLHVRDDGSFSLDEMEEAYNIVVGMENDRIDRLWEEANYVNEWTRFYRIIAQI